MKYKVSRTDVADSQIRSIILYIAEQFGSEVALDKLNELEESLLILEDNPNIGIAPKYLTLKRQGYKMLILKKNVVLYKIDEIGREVVIYAVMDQRRDYLNILQGL